MQISINGSLEQVEDDLTVQNLLAQKQVNSETVIVEVNLDILEVESFNTHIIKPDDSVEIIRFVGGG